MVFTKKIRRNSGRVWPRVLDKACAYLIPGPMWDDWRDRRDGMRSGFDKTHLRSVHMWGSEREEVKRYNEKQKKLLKIRKARKSGRA
jgi:hypothetical protein